jgi:hypothetical protein
MPSNITMSTKTVFFGYISFLREDVDAAIDIMSKREKDYLWFCFDPARVVQDGPATPYPNMGFSIMLHTDDSDETITDLEKAIAELPFLAYTLVVEKEGQERRVFARHR